MLANEGCVLVTETQVSLNNVIILNWCGLNITIQSCLFDMEKLVFNHRIHNTKTRKINITYIIYCIEIFLLQIVKKVNVHFVYITTCDGITEESGRT